MITQDNIKDSIVGWLGTKKDNNEDRHPVIKAIVAVALAALAFFILAYISWKAFGQWQELAKLKHERDVLAEEKERAKVARKLAELDNEAFGINKKIDKLDSDIAKLDEQIEALDKSWEMERKKVDEIENWDNIDVYTRNAGLTP